MSAELPVRKMSGDGLSICMDPIDFEMNQKQIYDAALDLNAKRAQDSDPFVSDPVGYWIPFDFPRIRLRGFGRDAAIR